MGLLLAATSLQGCGGAGSEGEPEVGQTGSIEQPLVVPLLNEGFELGWMFPP